MAQDASGDFLQVILDGAPGVTRTRDLLIRSPSKAIFRNSTKTNKMPASRMDIGCNKDP